MPARAPEAVIEMLPTAVGPVAALILLAAAAAAAFMTTAVGIGGGVFLLAVMGTLLPVSAAIPLHGIVQAASTGWRGMLLFTSIRWPLVAVFAAGCAAGAVIGAPLLVRLPTAWLELALAAFILIVVWQPQIAARGAAGSTGIVAGGAITGALTLFVGATGPLVAGLLRGLHLDRLQHVGTFSACMLVQHGVKLAVFGALGFVVGDWIWLLAAMIVCSLGGTIAGRAVLGRLADAVFRRLLATLLTLLAIGLAVRALLGLTG